MDKTFSFYIKLTCYKNVSIVLDLIQEFGLEFTEDIQSLGCWKDNKKRALTSLENTHYLLDGPYQIRSDPIKKCAQVAIDHDFTIFGIQNGGQCFGGEGGDKRYDMYGPSNLCNGMQSLKTYYAVQKNEVFH